MIIEKQPGTDWVVTVLVEGELIPVSVFGVETEEAAVAEARRSFPFNKDENAVKVVAVEKVDEGL